MSDSTNDTAKVGRPEEVVFTEAEIARIYYAAGHLHGSEAHPEDPNADASAELAMDEFKTILAARLATADARIAELEAINYSHEQLCPKCLNLVRWTGLVERSELDAANARVAELEVALSNEMLGTMNGTGQLVTVESELGAANARAEAAEKEAASYRQIVEEAHRACDAAGVPRSPVRPLNTRIGEVGSTLEAGIRQAIIAARHVGENYVDIAVLEARLTSTGRPERTSESHG